MSCEESSSDRKIGKSDRCARRASLGVAFELAEMPGELVRDGIDGPVGVRAPRPCRECPLPPAGCRPPRVARGWLARCEGSVPWNARGRSGMSRMESRRPRRDGHPDPSRARRGAPFPLGSSPSDSGALAIIDRRGRRSSGARALRASVEPSGSRSAGTAWRARAHGRAPAHPPLHASTCTSRRSARSRAARTPVEATASSACAREPTCFRWPGAFTIFRIDVLENLDVEELLGQELLQLRILRLERL